MKWTRIEDAQIISGWQYLSWDGEEVHKIADGNFPTNTTHIIKIIPPVDNVFNIDNIEYCILTHFKIGRRFLHSEVKSKQKKYCYPRHLLWYILKEYTDITLIDMAKQYGFDHTTFIHGINKIKNTMIYDDVKHDYEAILKLIQQ